MKQKGGNRLKSRDADKSHATRITRFGSVVRYLLEFNMVAQGSQDTKLGTQGTKLVYASEQKSHFDQFVKSFLWVFWKNRNKSGGVGTLDLDSRKIPSVPNFISRTSQDQNQNCPELLDFTYQFFLPCGKTQSLAFLFFEKSEITIKSSHFYREWSIFPRCPK